MIFVQVSFQFFLLFVFFLVFLVFVAAFSGSIFRLSPWNGLQWKLWGCICGKSYVVAAICVEAENHCSIIIKAVTVAYTASLATNNGLCSPRKRQSWAHNNSPRLMTWLSCNPQSNCNQIVIKSNQIKSNRIESNRIKSNQIKSLSTTTLILINYLPQNVTESLSNQGCYRKDFFFYHL